MPTGEDSPLKDRPLRYEQMDCDGRRWKNLTTNAYDYEHRTTAIVRGHELGSDGCKRTEVWTQPEKNDRILDVRLRRESRWFASRG